MHHFVGRAHEVLDDIGDPRLWAMTPTEIAESLAELESLKDRITAHQLALVAESDGADLAKGAGCTNTAAWVRSVTGLTGRTSSGVARQAKVLITHPAVAEALTRGEIRCEQATVIIKAVDALPAEVAHQAIRGEAHLLQAAREHDAKALETLGKHLLEVVAPEQTDALIAKKLAAEEAEADQDAYLQTWSDGNGSRHFKGKIPERHAAMLDAALEAIANPGRPNPIQREGVTARQVRGRGLCELAS